MMLIPVMWARIEGCVHTVRAEHEHCIGTVVGINSAVTEFGSDERRRPVGRILP